MVKDVTRYNRMALEVNAPVYAYYAEKILEETGVYQGVCLDVGCGGGYLGLALAPLCQLDFVFLDQSPAMLDCARTNISRFQLQQRATTVVASVQAMPLCDATVDLVVSRGSVPFWDDLPGAFSELYRVLRPGGRAYVGGGMGPPQLRERLLSKARKLDSDWQRGKPTIPWRPPGAYENALDAAGISNYDISRTEDGTWIQFAKG